MNQYGSVMIALRRAPVFAPTLRLMQPAVDLDGIATWPSAVTGFAERWAAALDGTTHVACDLALPEAAQDSFLALIGDRPVRAYHSTRLLEEEAVAVRSRDWPRSLRSL